MVQRFGIAMALACCLTAAPALFAQQQGQEQPQSNPNAQGQDQQDKKGNPFPTETTNVPVMPSNGAPPKPQPAQQKSNGQQPPQGQGQQGKGNPFPTDTGNVPVMPSNSEPDVPAGTPSDEGARYTLPGGDSDPVASPDGAASESSSEGVSSSDVRGLDSILPPPGGDEPTTGKRGRKRGDEIEGPPKESSKEDINVGQYYLDNKNWKAALSRFQSALVLAPDEPEVYWGLAESERHLGDYASAKANYQKVIEYDPDSKHAKEAKKALKDPEIANAKAPSTGQTPP